MGIKQHNGNTKADRLAELKIRSPSIQLIKLQEIPPIHQETSMV